MLAELAAANAAFAVIKTTIQNSGEIARVGKAIAQFVTGKEDIQRKVAGKDKASASGSDLEAFLALEEIRKREEELKQLMIYCGRPGLWGDYQRFCADARRARREEEKQQAKRRKKIFTIIALVVLFSIGAGAIAFIIILILLNASR